ncbi:MAG: metal-dependent transcriptional regulator [Eubacteriales bacterium]|nr:metal-dependent transcriptional regulator [Eubacteriales bacterium]
MKINKSVEDYLEAILMIQEQTGHVRSVDIAKQLNITKPSVSYMVKKLKENGFININTDGGIELIGEGLAIAKKIYARHKTLTDFFIKLGVDQKTAHEDACLIEHDLSSKTYKALCDYIDKEM